ncbi:lysoplasmalogenase [Streptomyces buecherae]|uniref:lysoplasmalogenase n=1 Tax=Streptomyces buecherae TaxID=2763006 RepID=UPI0033CB66FE
MSGEAARAPGSARPARPGGHPLGGHRHGRAVLSCAVLFALLTLAHLTALLVPAVSGASAEPVEYATKPALMPALAAYVLLRGGPRPLVGALLFGCGGDTLLQLGGEPAFLAGMASFAAGHVCYLVLFARLGPITAPRRTVALIAAGYVAAWLGTVALLWPGLAADLRGPVAAYSLLLTAMALAALRLGPWAGAGGALFLLSDTLIATGIADWPQPPVPQFWIMLTYGGAQLALTVGVLREAGRSGAREVSGPGVPEPGRAARRGA